VRGDAQNGRTIPIDTMKMFGTSMASRVVCTHGMCGHFITINRLLVGANFDLKIFIIFQILCSYNTGGKNSLSRCIRYNYFICPLYSPMLPTCISYTYIVFLKSLIEG
jgi:hypothetical protein